MPSNETKINLIEAGFRELRTSPRMQQVTEQAAWTVARAAGPGFEVKRALLHQDRERYFVVPRTPEAYKANYENLAVLQGLQRVAL